ncbi:hypothetical protein BDZ85DRAFT_279079 [Elsinoe ampelina]|uniref:Uncharacterized protein n=1 Tax=Elsinoe ampelina TaxID=302913 RepID=A0A6A6GIB8_9PEZI|nr:hypothetical protein BDZ85DRAFT_279079 [Elsinoe ampelina]
MRYKLLTASTAKAVILLLVTIFFLYSLLERDECSGGCDYEDDEMGPFETLYRPGWKGYGRQDNHIHFAEVNQAVVDIKGGPQSLPPPPKRSINFTEQSRDGALRPINEDDEKEISDSHAALVWPSTLLAPRILS